MPRRSSPKSKPPETPSGPILQVKMRLVGISPMIWRRVLLPVSWTLEELHGVIQAAMGWEGLHLYEFRVRAARYGSPDLCAGAADVTLESLRFRRNAKLTYTYDMGDLVGARDPDRGSARGGERPTLPALRGRARRLPAGGLRRPGGLPGRREEAMSSEAFEDLDTMASLLKAIVLDGRHELLDDEDKRWELEDARGAIARRASRSWPMRSPVARSTPASARTSTAASCTSGTDQPAAVAAQQVGGEGGDDLALGSRRCPAPRRGRREP